MGGAYSTEEMERKMLTLHLQNIQNRKAERPIPGVLEGSRRPFKLIRDNTTQTDYLPEPKCTCSEDASNPKPKAPDESQANFTNIYLSCHETPTKCFCDTFVQTEPASVHSRGVQIGVGVGEVGPDYDEDEDVNETEDSPMPCTSESSDTGSFGREPRQRPRRRYNTILTTPLQGKQNYDADDKYISSFSDDDDEDDESLLSFETPEGRLVNNRALSRSIDDFGEDVVEGMDSGYHYEDEDEVNEYFAASYDNNDTTLFEYRGPSIDGAGRPLVQANRSGGQNSEDIDELEHTTRVQNNKNIYSWKKYLSGGCDNTGENVHDDMDENKQLVKCKEEEEEFELRHLLDVDYCWKCECLQQDNQRMGEMVAQYEHIVKELSERDLMITDAVLSDTTHVKEQLQMDLNRAENGLIDAYSRIERLKTAVDKYKQGEDSMKSTLYDTQTKLQKSEGRYKKLRKHATEKVEAANEEISRLHEQRERELSSMREELQRCREQNKKLQEELDSKDDTNKELSQMCDELIRKVSDE